MPSAANTIKASGGRPKKFTEPSRPVTVTLPERTLCQLLRIDEDRARAIAKVTDLVAGSVTHPMQPVEIVAVAPGKSIIIVGPSKSLREIPWLRLVEVAPTRHLLVLPTGTPIESLEVTILDLIEKLSEEETEERALLNELRLCIGHQRRRKMMSTGEMLFINQGC